MKLRRVTQICVGKNGNNDEKEKRRKASNINGLEAYEGIYKR